ncbi:hypothetical protein [Mycolicibacterium pulveris]|uniref:hypothetical protein n=1 Tax=Mycolicibacterium pulveris TaxID=36813 RepID=UPI003CF64FE9
MSNFFRRISHQMVGYVFMLLSVVAFGLMVAGLALRSDLVPVAGIAFVIAGIAAISGFRNDAAHRATS